MKIALVTYALNIGGLETVLLSLANGLRESGCEVTFIITDARGAWHEKPMQEGFKIKAVLLHRLESRQSHAQRLAGELSGFDAVLLNHSRSAQSALGLLPEDTVAVSVLHNLSPEIFEVGLANLADLDRIVAVGERVRDEALLHGASAEKVVCIRNGVPIPPVRQQQTGLFSTERPMQVIYLGRVDHEQKGVLYLPSILACLKKVSAAVCLHIVGDGADQALLADTLEESDVSGLAIVHGAVDHKQAMSMLEDADVLIMPSHYEGQPVTLLEAMARGVVPVVSDLPGITDSVIQDGVDGFLVPVGDTCRFARILADLQDNTLRKKVSLAAREKAANNFSVEAMTQRYLRLVEGLAEQRKKRMATERSGTLHLELLGRFSYLPRVVQKVARFVEKAVVKRNNAHGN